MREVDSNDAQLAALSEINHSLRQQVIELVLSIAAMREDVDLLSGTISEGKKRTMNCERAKMTRAFGRIKSTDIMKMRGQRRS
jgi:hypothetical protein